MECRNAVHRNPQATGHRSKISKRASFLERPSEVDLEWSP